MICNWKTFKTNKYSLRNYLLINALVISSLALVTSYFQHDYDLGLGRNIWMVIPLALYIGIKLPTIMHNAVHRNFKKYNNLIGELSSQIILIGFGTVSVNHTFHHAFPDTENDPHSPIGKSFIVYLFTCLHSGVSVIAEGFFKFHGRSEQTRSIFKQCIFLHFGLIPVRLILWYNILGQTLFLYFFIPAFIIFLITFAHVNYITHTLDNEGNIIVVNKNSNLWYKSINFLSDGIYFHKNHHINPGLYNPQYLSRKI